MHLDQRKFKETERWGRIKRGRDRECKVKREGERKEEGGKEREGGREGGRKGDCLNVERIYFFLSSDEKKFLCYIYDLVDGTGVFY